MPYWFNKKKNIITRKDIEIHGAELKDGLSRANPIQGFRRYHSFKIIRDMHIQAKIFSTDDSLRHFKVHNEWNLFGFKSNI